MLRPRARALARPEHGRALAAVSCSSRSRSAAARISAPALPACRSERATMAEMDAPASPAASASASDGTAAGSPFGPDRAGIADADAAPAEPDLLLSLLSAMPAEERASCSSTFEATVKDLRRQREALAKQKKEVSRLVKTELKKKSRMLAKANRLTNNELLQVFAMRMKNKEARASSSEPQGSRP